MERNKDYDLLNGLANDLATRLSDTDVRLAMFGSATYGHTTITPGVRCKPGSDADLDLFLVLEDIAQLEPAMSLLDPSPLGADMFRDKYIDMLVVRGKNQERQISLHCVRPDAYKLLCDTNASQPFLLEYKRLKTKRPTVANRYRYPVFCVTCEHDEHSRIVPLQDGHLISYPLSNLVDGHFCLTVFQDQILTQRELIDDGFLAGQRNRLRDAVAAEANSRGAQSLDYFKLTKNYWDPSFETFMRALFNEP